MKIKESIGNRMFDLMNYLLMSVMLIIMVYPLINVIAVSISSASAITSGKVTWLPVGFNIHGYEIMLRNAELLVAYKNTILYSICGTFIMLLFTSLAAYSLAIKEFVFKKSFTIFLAVTLFFGGGLIPTFLTIRNLHMLNTFWVMILPGSVSAYNVFIFRTFFQGISQELRESAYVNHWNSWFNALIYLKDSDKFPLQMILRKMVILDDVRGGAYADSQISNIMMSMNVDPKNVQMAAIVLAMLPILFIYPFIQKYFVKGVMIGSVKG